MDTGRNSSSIEKCTCGTDKSGEPSQESDSSNSECSPKDKKLKISLAALGLKLRRGRSKRNNKKTNNNNNNPSTSSSSGSSSSTTASSSKNNAKKASPKWPLKLNCCIKKVAREAVIPQENNVACCKGDCFKKIDEPEIVGDVVTAAVSPAAAVLPVEENANVSSSNFEGVYNNGLELNENNSAEVVEVERPQNENEEVRGIYGISRNSSCICIGPWDMHW